VTIIDRAMGHLITFVLGLILSAAVIVAVAIILVAFHGGFA
jgi:hypothetical protein